MSALAEEEQRLVREQKRLNAKETAIDSMRCGEAERTARLQSLAEERKLVTMQFQDLLEQKREAKANPQAPVAAPAPLAIAAATGAEDDQGQQAAAVTAADLDARIAADPALVDALGEACRQELGLPPQAAVELLRFLWLLRQRQQQQAQQQQAAGAGAANSGGNVPAAVGTASPFSPSLNLGRLWHWVLLNSRVRDAVHELVGGDVAHTTATVNDPESEKAARRQAALDAMSAAGWQPQLEVWKEPGTAMARNKQQQGGSSAADLDARIAAHPTLMDALMEVCKKVLRLPPQAVVELLRFLWIVRHQQQAKHDHELSPSAELERLWRHVLLDTRLRDAVHELVGGDVAHASPAACHASAHVGEDETRTAATSRDFNRCDVRRRLTAINALAHAGWQPDLELWQEPGTAMARIVRVPAHPGCGTPWMYLASADERQQREREQGPQRLAARMAAAWGARWARQTLRLDAPAAGDKRAREGEVGGDEPERRVAARVDAAAADDGGVVAAAAAAGGAGPSAAPQAAGDDQVFPIYVRDAVGNRLRLRVSNATPIELIRQAVGICWGVWVEDDYTLLHDHASVRTGNVGHYHVEPEDEFNLFLIQKGC